MRRGVKRNRISDRPIQPEASANTAIWLLIERRTWYPFHEDAVRAKRAGASTYNKRTGGESYLYCRRRALQRKRFLLFPGCVLLTPLRGRGEEELVKIQLCEH